ncbi:hypothetical protein A5634_06200 [Mycobacterium asiaticum]|uniref:WXG100 family type VII secretion target n=1 Tax=Mycobacterium asiaticum TaxID=1790 RepID=A0A1A3NMR0_MYCAS|nr:hypothetical protein A5634_06200 [Mycobacterium asiaticum]
MRANPDVLSHLGTELAGHGQSLSELQRSCHRDADDAQAGWVGSSAHALSGLLTLWESASAGHVARFDQHSSGMRVAAAVFTELDQSNAAALR